MTKAKQDSNHEFISLLACVAAIGKTIPPVLIYKGASGSLQGTWVEDITSQSSTYFALTENGWSSIAIGLVWLQKVFERHTKPASSRTKSLLLVDGHSIHVNMAFINWADNHGIVIMILPPHSTHRLQPLDVGLFGPLSSFYSDELNNLLAKGGGLVSMSKRLFHGLFEKAWKKAFTEVNTQHAFEKPGVWHIDGTDMIARVTRPSLKLQEEPNTLKTLRSSKTIRHFRAAFEKSPSKPRINKLFKAIESQSSEISILEHENSGLREAIILEKKKRKKGARLNLCGEATSGGEIYSPAKVARPVAYHDEKDILIRKEKQEKEARKIQRAITATENKLKKAEKVAAREAKQAEEQLAKEMQVANQAYEKSSPKQAFLQHRPLTCLECVFCTTTPTLWLYSDDAAPSFVAFPSFSLFFFAASPEISMRR